MRRTAHFFSAGFLVLTNKLTLDYFVRFIDNLCTTNVMKVTLSLHKIIERERKITTIREVFKIDVA